jgi:hypothetical protein
LAGFGFGAGAAFFGGVFILQSSHRQSERARPVEKQTAPLPNFAAVLAKACKVSFSPVLNLALRKEINCNAGKCKPVGSRTGAVFRRFSLAIAPRFLWECLSSQTVNPFPAPATSHPACGFPALGAPVCLVPRVMWPIILGRLSRLTIGGAGSR